MARKASMSKSIAILAFSTLYCYIHLHNSQVLFLEIKCTSYLPITVSRLWDYKVLSVWEKELLFYFIYMPLYSMCEKFYKAILSKKKKSILKNRKLKSYMIYFFIKNEKH